MSVDVRVADRSQLEVLVDVLAKAFATDPIARYVFADDTKRDAQLRRFFRTQLRHHYFPRGEIYIAEEGPGVAMWMPPTVVAPKLRDVFAQLPLFVSTVVQSTTMVRLARVLAAHHPRNAHYYLGTIAVDPDAQGRGIGSALLAPVLRRCDEESICAYLESSSERNASFYGRLGFVVMEQISAPQNGPPIWLMWREPKRPRTDDSPEVDATSPA